MNSRFATTTSSRASSQAALQSSRSTGKVPSDKSLATSRNVISTQLLNIYYQQKEVALNMFDEWSHEQKINFLLSLMPRASYRQLVHVVNWFQDNIPIWSLDFTTVLPRFLSLYIFSFLDTKSLVRASTVCWRWKFIAEQDVLWRNRCVKLGWQLPFYPTENEYGAWKKYYAKNYVQLRDMGLATPFLGDLHPLFSTKFDPNHTAGTVTRVVHQSIASIPRLKLTQDSTPGYNDMRGLQTAREDDLWIFGAVDTTSLVLKDRKKLLSEVGVGTTPGSLHEALSVENVMEQRLQKLTNQDWNPPTTTSPAMSCILGTYSEKDHFTPRQPNPIVGASFPVSYPAWLGQTVPASANPRVLLISNQVPAAELLAIAVAWSTVEAIVYDFQGSTPESLIKDLNCLLGHRMAKSIGIVLSQNESCLQNGFLLTGNCYVTLAALDNPSDSGRKFFCSLGASLLPRASGGDGHVDIFAPLLMHSEGAQLLVQLNAATGIVFHCPQTVRGDYEYMFENCDWIVTKASLGLLERPAKDMYRENDFSLSLQSGLGTFKTVYGSTLSTKMPPKLYFEENRLAFWLKSYKIVHRSMGKIRRDLTRTFEYRTESCLLNRLIGQAAFDEFRGAAFSHVMSIWPEICEAIRSAAQPDVNASIGFYENEDEDIEWRMAKIQHPTVAIASKLLEQAGYCIRQNLQTPTRNTASQSQAPLPLLSKNTQTMSMILPTTNYSDEKTDNPKNDVPSPKKEEVPVTEDVPSSSPEKPATQAADETTTTQTVVDSNVEEQSSKTDFAELDSNSLLIGERVGENVTFTGAVVGEGESNSSSGVIISSDKSDTTDYPFDNSCGIRSLEVCEPGGDGVPVRLDVSWTIERVRVQNGKPNTKNNKSDSRLVYSVLFTEADRRLIAARDLFECESRYNKILAGVQTAFVYPLNQAVFQERAILSTNNIKLLFSDLLQLLDISNEFLEAFETRLDNWVDVEGQMSDVILTFVCGRWNVFLSYMNNYPVLLETLDRCCDEQRLFRSFMKRNERSLPIRMLSMPEVFTLPFDQIAAYRSHFRRLAAHTEQSHLDTPGLREARKLMNQYCALVAERAASHTKNSNKPLLLEASFRSLELSSVIDDVGTVSSYVTPLPKFDECSSDLQLLRDCPFALDAGSNGERRFVCRQDITLMRPVSGRQLPFEMQFFEEVDEIGFFLFSDCLVVAKRRATHRPYVRDADVAFYYSNCVPTRDLVQIDFPDTKYISNTVEYRSKQYRWLVVFPEHLSKTRFIAVIAPYINSQIATPSPRLQHHN